MYTDRGTIVFDCEACAIDGAGTYLEPVSAPSNYKDELKIAAYIQQAQREQLERAALDVDLARIVALGVLRDTDVDPVVLLLRDEQDERDALTVFWQFVTHDPHYRAQLVGFNCLGYDLPLLLRRSQYLGVPAPALPIHKYRHDGIDDLMLALSFDGTLKYHGLDFYCKRFGLEVPEDHTSGKDVAALIAADDWDGVAAHCRADVLKTAALAHRLGVLRTSEVRVR